MFSGFCAAIVGLIISSELMASHPATGESFELNAIAAAVLGGTSMSGGRGTIGGTIVGAFVIGILSDGLVMMGVSSFWQMVIKGLVIIVGDQFGIERRYSDAAALFANETLDFADIATTVGSHRPLVEMAAANRVPVICQKPFAPTLADAKAMVKACADAGVPLMVHENFRWQS